MSKIKQSFSKFGILLFSFLLMAYSPQEGWSADKSTSSVVKAAKNVETQFSQLTKSAESGDAEVQYKLGERYYYGSEEAPLDHEKAVFWFKKAAEQGHVDAQWKLGKMYANGEGVPKDYKKSFFWYEKVAERGDVEIQYMLGEIYESKNDAKKAYFWYEKAAEQEHPDAQYTMGAMYYFGYGVSRDFEKAVFWLEKAAENGSKQAPNALDNINRIGK